MKATIHFSNQYFDMGLECLKDDSGNIVITSGSLKIPKCYLDNNDCLSIFNENHKVQDVWRYIIKIKNNISKVELGNATLNFAYKDKPATDSASKKSILLLLESPHRDEYDENFNPKAPAQGSTGRSIDRNIKPLIMDIKKHHKNNLSGNYNLIISNPIQYNCSLGAFYKTGINTVIRDHIWKKIWFYEYDKKYPTQDEFMERYRLYNPEITINCCTKELQPYVTQLLCDKNASCVFEAYHPSAVKDWNKNNFNLKKCF